jgi:D-serine deaminase-like pyridoxal phosphate-dependent protein
VTAYRAGTYVFHDRSTVAAGAATLDDVALTVHATVVSRPQAGPSRPRRGSKSLSQDPAPETSVRERFRWSSRRPTGASAQR